MEKATNLESSYHLALRKNRNDCVIVAQYARRSVAHQTTRIAVSKMFLRMQHNVTTTLVAGPFLYGSEY